VKGYESLAKVVPMMAKGMGFWSYVKKVSDLGIYGKGYISFSVDGPRWF